MSAFIEESQEAFGVEPICRTLQFAPATYYDRRAIAQVPDRASARARSDAARCTVEHLMRRLGIRGVVRGKRVITTRPDTSQPCPDDKVNRLFTADRPNKLRVRSIWRHWFKPNGRRFHRA
jgi:putative transposase